jgi:hypothetical protein
LFAIARETSTLDDAAPLEKLDGPTVSDSIERDGKLEIARIDAEVGAGHRDSLRIARELKIRRCRLERIELDVAI